jgi:hypothetical protein
LNCLSGTGADWDTKGFGGFPKEKVSYVEGVGYNQTYSITSPAGQSLQSNVWSANFYNPSDHPFVPGNGTVPAGSDPNRPIPMRIPPNVGATEEHFPSDTYEVVCYSRAQEIQARIRVMLREWSSGPITENGDPDENVGSDPDFPGNPINDVRDWEDFELEGIPYPTSLT